jgi:hypothetical protein
MKLLICISLLVSMSAFAKTKIDFSQALNEDVEQDIKKDDDKFKKEAARGPASVAPVEHENATEDTPKIDKNVRQIGPNKW